MNTTLKLLAVCIGLSTLGISACHDDDAPSTNTAVAETKTFTVTPSLGKITKGRILLKNLSGQSISDIKDITANGTVTFTIDSTKLNDPIIAEVLPAADGKLEYADEAIADKLVTISENANKAVVRAAASITSTNQNIGVTALTEAALNYAQGLSAQLTKANIETANQKITEQLKLTKFNLTDAPVVIDRNNFSPILNAFEYSESQRAYAAYLTTLAKEAKRLNSASTQPAYDILKAFSRDFSDGSFDGKQGQTALTDYSSSFISAWAKWVETFYASIFKLQNTGDLTAWLGAFNAQTPAIPTPTAPAVAIRTVDGVAEYACSDANKIRSMAGQSLNIDFVNSSGATINIDWIDYTGGLINYKKDLATGQTHSQQTFTSHPWKISNAQGVCRGIFVATTVSKKILTINANDIVIGQNPTTPVTPPVTTDSCASRKLPTTTLSSIIDYDGDYKNSGAVVLNLTTATAKAVVKGTTGNITEVCGPNVQNNGTNHVLITDKGAITLFKDTAGKYTAESADFSGFFGEKVTSNSTALCESNGADDKLGFKNAPADFCGFNKASSIAITSPDIYTFFNADKKQNVKVTVENNAVKSIQLEDNTYAWACGVGTLPACGGVTFSNSGTYKQFAFNNTELAVINGKTQALTIKNGLLIHMPSTNNTSSLPGGSASGKITNVQYNKNGTNTGGSGEFRAQSYEFSGNLATAYVLKIIDKQQDLRYELANRNGKFTAINLYSGASSNSPIFVYTCDTTGDSNCLDKISLTTDTSSTLVFNNMKLRGVSQPQFDIIINGQVKLNP